MLISDFSYAAQQALNLLTLIASLWVNPLMIGGHLLVLYFPVEYKTIYCKSTNKNNVCNKWYHTYHNSLENLNQYIGKFPKTFYSVSSSNGYVLFKLIRLNFVIIFSDLFEQKHFL